MTKHQSGTLALWINWHYPPTRFERSYIKSAYKGRSNLLQNHTTYKQTYVLKHPKKHEISNGGELKRGAVFLKPNGFIVNELHSLLFMFIIKQANKTKEKWRNAMKF